MMYFQEREICIAGFDAVAMHNGCHFTFFVIQITLWVCAILQNDITKTLDHDRGR